MMIVTKHITQDHRLLLAVCDSNLLGKCFEQDGKVMDLSSDFFNGSETDKKGTMVLMKKAYMLNLVGSESVDTGIGVGLVEKSRVMKIEDIPFAQVLCIQE